MVDLLKLAPTDRVLGAVIGGVVLIGLSLWLLTASKNETAGIRITDFSVPATLEPVWAERSVGVAPSAGGELVIYLDVSHSMGGFFSLTSVDASTVGLSSAAQLLPGYLLSGYPGRLTRWKSVAQEVRSLSPNPVFVRSSFTGSQSFLEPAVKEALMGLEDGRLAAAVLITDLVDTAGPQGAMALARPLAPWISSPAVRSGIFDFGLLGVKVSYWGVHSSRCPQRGELGCYYSEHANAYLPLPAPVNRPAYFLFIGRVEEGESAVDRLGNHIANELREIGLETQWELLTGGGRTRPARLDCEVRKKGNGMKRGNQYALVRLEDGSVKCLRDDVVELECQLLLEGSEIDPLPLRHGEASWSAVEIEFREGRLYADVHCERLRRRDLPRDDLRFEPLQAEASLTGAADWSGWTAFSDERPEDLTGTLQLSLFLDQLRLRPAGYRVETSEPIFKVAGNGR